MKLVYHKILANEARSYFNSPNHGTGLDMKPDSKDTSRKYYAILLDDPNVDIDDKQVAFVKIPGNTRMDDITNVIEQGLSKSALGYDGPIWMISNKIKPKDIPNSNVGSFKELFPTQYDDMKSGRKPTPYNPTKEEMLKKIRARRMRELIDRGIDPKSKNVPLKPEEQKEKIKFIKKDDYKMPPTPIKGEKIAIEIDGIASMGYTGGNVDELPTRKRFKVKASMKDDDIRRLVAKWAKDNYGVTISKHNLSITKL